LHVPLLHRPFPTLYLLIFLSTPYRICLYPQLPTSQPMYLPLHHRISLSTYTSFLSHLLEATPHILLLL
jgi:hypothetical protein